MKQVTLSTANQASGVALALVTILIWGLSLKGIVIPDNVSDAITVCVAGGVHWLTSLSGKEKPSDPA